MLSLLDSSQGSAKSVVQGEACSQITWSFSGWKFLALPSKIQVFLKLLLKLVFPGKSVSSNSSEPDSHFVL